MRAVVMMAMAVAMFMSAYGVKVHDTVNKGDARWMSTSKLIKSY